MDKNQQQLKQMADRIYSFHFGHLDDRKFWAEKTQEIMDWLGAGQPTGLAEAIREWAEYDAEEIVFQGGYYTPAEAAALTSTAASSWRNRAAAGKLPGAIKKGKQWLIPAKTVQMPVED